MEQQKEKRCTAEAAPCQSIRQRLKTEKRKPSYRRATAIRGRRWRREAVTKRGGGKIKHYKSMWLKRIMITKTREKHKKQIQLETIAKQGPDERKQKSRLKSRLTRSRHLFGKKVMPEMERGERRQKKGEVRGARLGSFTWATRSIKKNLKIRGTLRKKKKPQKNPRSAVTEERSVGKRKQCKKMAREL